MNAKINQLNTVPRLSLYNYVIEKIFLIKCKFVFCELLNLEIFILYIL